MSLAGKTIVVTGSSGGLGRAMADRFVAGGADVVYTSNQQRELEAAVDAVADEAGHAIAVPADVRSWSDVRQLVGRATDAFGTVDVLVNNAGVIQPKVNPDHSRKSVAELPIRTWDTIIETNLRGTFLCTRAVLPDMLSADAGRVIHVSSGHGVRGRADRAPYVASKFAIEGFHESLALELEGTNVDSIAIRPPDGGVFTESMRAYGRTPEDFENESPDVIAGPAARIAAGEGDNGGRYLATPDGEDFVEYTRA